MKLCQSSFALIAMRDPSIAHCIPAYHIVFHTCKPSVMKSVALVVDEQVADGTGASAEFRNAKISSPEGRILRQRCMWQRPDKTLVNSGPGGSNTA